MGVGVATIASTVAVAVLKIVLAGGTAALTFRQMLARGSATLSPFVTHATCLLELSVSVDDF